MTRVRRLRVAGLMFAFLLLAAGCASKGDLSGTVKYKGQALKFGQVTFQGSDGKIVAADIQPDGKYSAKGLPLGSVKVGVTCSDAEAETKWFRDASAAGRNAMEGKGGAGPKGNPDQFLIVPRKFGDFNSSGLSADVKGGPQVHDIDIQ